MVKPAERITRPSSRRRGWGAIALGGLLTWLWLVPWPLAAGAQTAIPPLEQAAQWTAAATTAYDQGDYDTAIALMTAALDLYRQTLGEHHPYIATVLISLARLHQALGQSPAAIEHYEAAIALLQTREEDANQQALGEALGELGSVYQTQGRYDEAADHLQAALAVRRATLGASDPAIADGLNRLASLRAAQGRYGDAIRDYGAAIALRQTQLGPDHPDVGQSLNGLAGVYQAQGRYDEAEALFQQTLALYRRAYGADHLFVATVLNNLGLLYQDQGRYEEAADLLQQALTLRTAQLPANHPDLAVSANNLALAQWGLGRYPEAAAGLQRAIAAYGALGRLLSLATSWNNLALVYHAQGDAAAGWIPLQTALTLRQETLGPSHPDVAQTLTQQGVLAQALGDTAGAIAALAAGLALEENLLRENLVQLDDEARRAYVAQFVGNTYLAIALDLQTRPSQPAATDLALTTLLRRKGRLLDVAAQQHRQRQTSTAADQALLTALQQVQRQRAALVFNPGPLSSDAYTAQLTALTTEARRLQAQLSPDLQAQLAPEPPVTVAAVAAQLPADAVLVEYVRYRPFRFGGAGTPSDRWGGDRYGVYLLFPDGTQQSMDLGEAAAIDAAVAAFVASLRDPTRDPGPAARHLSALVVDPIQAQWQGFDQVLIAPDGQLNRIPFEALQTPEATYLVERYRLSYLNSGRDLLRMVPPPPANRPGDRPTPPVIFANPDYQVAIDKPLSNQRSPGPALPLGQLRVGPLPGTAAEAAAILPFLPQARLFTASAATENALKQVRSPRILHIATHGFFWEGTAATDAVGSRGLGLQPTLGGSLPTSPSPVTVADPLLRSGLALAGFNRRTSGSEDGVLTALEVTSLDLLGTQLVVLSACDTGRGDIANGEGVYGLRRAFALAGAEAQVLSLWQVDDLGTQALMATYYENLSQGQGRSAALRQGQLALLRGDGPYRHPYYWAAFILAGDWRSL
ncbi:MAG: CHAT domain-containing protein [Leptolyngbya sp.]|nr:CHAT domain-containing protein [Leptolyngbya sp.]